MKLIIKKILNKLLNILNLELIKKDNMGVIDKSSLIPFQKTNRNYNLYYEGLKKSENMHTDHLWKQSRHLDLLSLVEIVLKKGIEGHFAEAGCWKGHSSYMISKLISENLEKYDQKKIEFHIFDSFEGLSEIKDEDTNVKKLEKNRIDHIRKQFISDEKFLKEKVLKNFDFIKIHKGWIPEKFDKVKNEKFSFVHIDVDLYEPTKQSLEFFFPRLVNGGIIICDDYNQFEFDGAKKAWDNFFLKNKVSLNFAPALGSSFIIK